ncbi:ribosome silencing factor [Azospira inquinata]|uniref:Ribosomal silencing factor RsfS n=1 Tax=Azospira inquinata TaxID=2785627 RepID=A0A975SKK3_9RHOO|nr:ribosome silencing factor [Azospira inquinata]QWT46698.1 ribosome silencing factor [Azospira inquinata]QWT47978.1 ribosome silencing factor [Azospira inquinata]
MEVSKLEHLVVEALEDIKGKDIQIIDTTPLTSLFDRVIIASGDSNRQVKSLARSVQEMVREAGGEVISVEGEENGEWVLVDLGDVVVHVMQPAVRSYYNLEEIWGGEPVAPRRTGLFNGDGRPVL